MSKYRITLDKRTTTTYLLNKKGEVVKKLNEDEEKKGSIFVEQYENGEWELCLCCDKVETAVKYVEDRKGEIIG